MFLCVFLLCLWEGAHGETSRHLGGIVTSFALSCVVFVVVCAPRASVLFGRARARVPAQDALWQARRRRCVWGVYLQADIRARGVVGIMYRLP